MSDTVTFDLANANDASLVERSVPRRLGPVFLECEIGRGAMGVVFRGRHEILGRDVAVKLLLHAVSEREDPHFDRFRVEARMAAAVRHPNLTMIHHADVVDGIPYLVMDYIDGPSLGAVIRQSGALPIDAALAAALAMTDAVAALHGNGIVHRDIKPNNTLLDRDGHVFVTDFGLALARTRPGASMTPSGVAGTPTYMAPEMFDGLVSPRSDVYALGITTFELMTGSPPFIGPLLAVHGGDELLRSFAVHVQQSVQKQHVESPLPVAALEDLGVTPAIIDVLERATHKNATFRYKTADYYRQALEAVTDGALRASGRAVLKDLAARFVALETPPAVDAPTSRTPTTTYFDLLGQIADQKRQRVDGETGLETVQSRQTGNASSLDGDVAQQPEATTETRRSEESDDPRRILRLQRCPQCDYDFRTLPEEHRCPECGFAYDPSMFAVYGWSRKERYSVTGALLIGTWGDRLLAVLMSTYFVWIVAMGAYSRWKTWSGVAGVGVTDIMLFSGLVIMVIGGIVGTPRLRSHVRRSREERWGTIQLLFTKAGASKRRGPGEPRFVPWERIRRVRFRKLRSIAGGKRLWRLRLTIPFFRYWGREPFQAFIECTPKEAARVRAEIRRRLRPPKS